MVPLEVLNSKTVVGVLVIDDMVKLSCSDGSVYEMSHSQECCESVVLTNPEDAASLEDAMILMASEENPDDPPLDEYNDDSHTWTFFTIRTTNGVHVLKWFGSSNGYYSESVQFYEIEPPSSAATGA